MSVCVNFSQADGRHNRLFSSLAGVYFFQVIRDRGAVGVKP